MEKIEKDIELYRNSAEGFLMTAAMRKESCCDGGNSVQNDSGRAG
jgi:hypothetical protein